MSVPCDTGIDEGGVEFGDRLVIHFVFPKSVWEIVLDEHIAVFDQLVQDGGAGRRGEGETERLLISIDL